MWSSSTPDGSVGRDEIFPLLVDSSLVSVVINGLYSTGPRGGPSSPSSRERPKFRRVEVSVVGQREEERGLGLKGNDTLSSWSSNTKDLQKFLFFLHFVLMSETGVY